MDPAVVVTPPYVAGPLRLEPFRALRMRSSRIGDPASARLFARPYRRVPARVSSWLARGDLTRDRKPGLYVHEYTENGMTIRGVVGALDLRHPASGPQDAAVFPHEGVHPNQVSVLASRLTQMSLQPAPILLTQETPAPARAILTSAVSESPAWAFDDRGGQRHRVWTITDPGTIERLNHAWAGSRAMIADGHHRLAAYLAASTQEADIVAHDGLAMIVDQTTTPLHLGAIHRRLHGLTLGELAAAARRRQLAWWETDRTHALAELRPGTLVLTDSRNWAVLELPRSSLDTAVQLLHAEFLPTLKRAPRRITFHHTVEDALDTSQGGPGVAVLLPAPTVEQLWAVVRQGFLLPEKATSFQPKPHAGVLIRQLPDGPAGP